MGGLITLAHLVERKPVVASAVVSGPPLSMAEAPAFQLFMGKVLSRVWPTFALTMNLDADGLSRDPEVARRYLADPLVERIITAGLAAELSRAVARTAAAAAEIAVPLFALYGEADPICPPAATCEFMDRVGTSGSRLRGYPDLRHEILNEPERERVRSDILGWWKELSQ